MDIKQKIESLGLTLPECPTPIAEYVPAMRFENTIVVSGQLPSINGDISQYIGKVPNEISKEKSIEASKICFLNNISAAMTLIEQNETLRLIQMQGFIQSSEGFYEQPIILNGASELAAQIFGENGIHSRIAVGVNALPKNACIEISCTFQAIKKEINYSGRMNWIG